MYVNMKIHIEKRLAFVNAALHLIKTIVALIKLYDVEIKFQLDIITEIKHSLDF